MVVEDQAKDDKNTAQGDNYFQGIVGNLAALCTGKEAALGVAFAPDSAFGITI
jgi:hypothetical protein